MTYVIASAFYDRIFVCWYTSTTSFLISLLVLRGFFVTVGLAERLQGLGKDFVLFGQIWDIIW